MKKLLIILMVVAMASLIFTGCALIDWISPDTPVVPAVMEADVDAVLIVGVDVDKIAWSIENVGTLDIPAYKMTFDVLYSNIVKDNVIFTEVGYELDVGEKHGGLLTLAPYDSPAVSAETVSVSWELFD